MTDIGVRHSDPPSLRSVLLTALTPLLLSLVAGLFCYVAVGATMGLFFGGVVIVALLAPPLALAHRDRMRQVVAVSSVVDGVAIVWLVAVADPSVSLVDWVRAYLLLGAWGAAVWGVAELLRRAGAPSVGASAITVVLALAWLAWPVWLSPWIAGRDGLVAWLVWPHPLFGLDGALRHLGPPWTERHLMYTRLTVLNQDVSYALPRGVLVATLLHAGVALACLLPYRRVRAFLPQRPQRGGERGHREGSRSDQLS
jgi:hypothetical protein